MVAKRDSSRKKGRRERTVPADGYLHIEEAFPELWHYYVRKKFIAFLKRNKWWVLGLIIAVMLAIFFFTAKLYLLYSFTIGRDIFITLESDTTSVNLHHSQSMPVHFKASVSTNPFCKAQCTYNFSDISTGVEIASDMFIIGSLMPIHREFSVQSPDSGSGVLLYRFNMVCRGMQSYLCYTSGEPVEKAILVTAVYNISEEGSNLRSVEERDILSARERLSMAGSYAREAGAIISSLNGSVILDREEEDYLALLGASESAISKLQNIASLWSGEDYAAISEQSSFLSIDAAGILENASLLVNRSLSLLNMYNDAARIMATSRDAILNISDSLILDYPMAELINDSISQYADSLDLFEKKNSIEVKGVLARNANSTSLDLLSAFQEYASQAVQERQKELVLLQRIFCNLTERCNQSAAVIDADVVGGNASGENDTMQELKELCMDITALKRMETRALNDSSFNFSDYNETQLVLANQAYNALADYLSSEPVPNISASSFTDQNMTTDFNLSLLELGILANSTKECASIAPFAGYSDRGNASANSSSGNSLLPPAPLEVLKPKAMASEINITLKTPLPQCCAYGVCNDCCIDGVCMANPGLYPVLLLHGHSLDRGTSVEFSINSISSVQDYIESIGVINTGAFNQYSPDNVSAAWQMLNNALSLRASYYYDYLSQEGALMAFQSKNEEIDNYAVRLNEIVKLLKHETGKDKVVIVAYSMGGLVARRYLQIFGAGDVDKLILFFTPNHGISGWVRKYCTVTGEPRECQDMDSSSVFMKKINSGSLPNLPIYNLVGVGCKMDFGSGEGDGIVLKESAYLDDAENFIINGTCESGYFHSTVLDSGEYPQPFSIIASLLSQETIVPSP